MVRKISIKKIGELILADTGELLSPKEIWNEAKESKRKEIQERLRDYKGKTPWATLGAQLYLDLKNNPNTMFYQPIDGAQKFCLAIYKDKFNNLVDGGNESNIAKKEHHHYIIMLDENPDHFHPDDKKIKIGYGEASRRLASYWTNNPDAFVYREWIHERNIEGDLLELAEIFGQCQAKPGKKYGSEVFIISKNRLDKLVRHYDEHVFDKRIDVE